MRPCMRRCAGPGVVMNWYSTAAQHVYRSVEKYAKMDSQHHGLDRLTQVTAGPEHDVSRLPSASAPPMAPLHAADETPHR